MSDSITLGGWLTIDHIFNILTPCSLNSLGCCAKRRRRSKGEGRGMYGQSVDTNSRVVSIMRVDQEQRYVHSL